jgi:hypothetical protein
VAHHPKALSLGAGVGQKADDKYAVPLCVLHHAELHDFGDEDVFWAIKGIDICKAILDLTSAYLSNCRYAAT